MLPPSTLQLVTITCSTEKYCSVARRSELQSDLKPISSMLGDSLPRPARVRQDLGDCVQWIQGTVAFFNKKKMSNQYHAHGNS